jgi:hypothetical protein
MVRKTKYQMRLNPFRHLSKGDKQVLIKLYQETAGKPFTLKQVKEIVPSSQYLRSLKDRGKVRKVSTGTKKDGAVIWQIPEGLAYDIKTVLEQEAKAS